MSAQDHWVGEVVNHVCSFVPKQKWFSNPEDANVWVSAYRVYRVPSDIVSLKRPLIANFEQARAVFLRWNAPYQKLEHKVIEQKDGRKSSKLIPFGCIGRETACCCCSSLPCPTTKTATTNRLQGRE